MNLASSSVRVSFARCPSSEPKGGDQLVERVPRDLGHAVVGLQRAARFGERVVQTRVESVRLDVAASAEPLEQASGQRTVFLEPVAVEVLG